MQTLLAKMFFLFLLPAPPDSGEAVFARRSPLEFTIKKDRSFVIDTGGDVRSFDANPDNRTILLNLRNEIMVLDFSEGEVKTRKVPYRNGEWEEGNIRCISLEGKSELISPQNFHAIQPQPGKRTTNRMLTGRDFDNKGRLKSGDKESTGTLPVRKEHIYGGREFFQPSACSVDGETIPLTPESDQRIQSLYFEPSTEWVVARTDHMVVTNLKSKRQVIFSGASLDGENYALNLSPIPYTDYFLAALTPYVKEQLQYDGTPLCFITNIECNILSNVIPVPFEISVSRDYFVMMRPESSSISYYFEVYLVQPSQEGNH